MGDMERMPAARERVGAGCELCPRRCRADRDGGERGFCGAGDRVEVYRYGPHHGEEPPLSGSRGSGTVFFSRCTLRCLYCQNYPWSQDGAGQAIGTARLAAVLRELREAGCHNWNWVSPTPWLPAIRDAVREAEADGRGRLPCVYNTSGYERPETLSAFADVADVFLTDLRYARADSAAEGSGAEDYVDRARAALRAMWRMAGPLVTDADGLARRGTICRVLVLPGRAHEAIETLEWLADEIGTEVAVSVMSQYVPAHRAAGRGDAWGRRVSASEFESVADAVSRWGFVNGWVQEFEGEAESNLIGYAMPPCPAAPGGGKQKERGCHERS